MTFTLKPERDPKLKFLSLGTSIILFIFANHKHFFYKQEIWYCGVKSVTPEQFIGL